MKPGQCGEPLGLEAGSKAELMAVLAHAGMTRSVIVCNGYKDREYIRLALMGEKLGHKVYLVIEKCLKSPWCLKKPKSGCGTAHGRAGASGVSGIR